VLTLKAYRHLGISGPGRGAAEFPLFDQATDPEDTGGQSSTA
jgi:hypothetical protein